MGGTVVTVNVVGSGGTANDGNEVEPCARA